MTQDRPRTFELRDEPLQPAGECQTSTSVASEPSGVFISAIIHCLHFRKYPPVRFLANAQAYITC